MCNNKVTIFSILLLSCIQPLKGQDLCIKYQKLFSDILLKSNISPNAVKLICDPDVNVEEFTFQLNGMSEIKIGLRKIARYPDVVFCGVVAHELGHLIFKHEGNPIFKNEQLADSICGSIMRKLGFDVEDMANIITYFEGQESIYGTKKQRIGTYKKGWLKENELEGLALYQAYTPKITWEVLGFKKLSVWIGERQIIIHDFYNHGIVFDSVTNSTLQLVQWDSRIGCKGVGRLVTNRTLYTYRVTKIGFNLYYKADEVTLDECTRDTLKYVDNDGITPTCDNKEIGFPVQWQLNDYKLAPYKYCMPAQIFIKP